MLSHSAYYLAALGVPAAINFSALAVYTRMLSPREYGIYALVLSAVGVANAIFFWWLRLGLLRFAAARDTGSERLLSTLSGCFVGTIVCTGVIGIAVYPFSARAVSPRLLVLSLALLWAQAWFELNLELLRSRLEPVRYGLLSTLRAALALLFGASLVHLGMGAPGVLIGLVGAALVPAVLSASAGMPLPSRLGMERRLVRRLLVFGLPLALKSAFDLAMAATGRFSLAWLAGSHAAGVYAASFDLGQQSVGVLLSVAYLAGYPVIVRALEDHGFDAASRRMSDHLTVLLAIACPATVGLALVAPSVVHLLLGEGFRAAGLQLIPVVALTAALGGIKAHYLDLSFQLGRRTVAQIALGAVAAAVCLGANLLLIPRFGLLGAAYGTLAGYLAAAALSWRYGRRVFRFPAPRFEDGLVLLATLLMAAALWLLPRGQGMWFLLLQLSVGAAVYIAALVSLNVKGARGILMAHLSGKVSSPRA